uniref:Uncharacterized protein n=1 Tax=Arundo donax TaxID=35708 RepID=A0A0A8ZG86_ARUDO
MCMAIYHIIHIQTFMKSKG